MFQSQPGSSHQHDDHSQSDSPLEVLTFNFLLLPNLFNIMNIVESPF